jgi:small GTP-binding protein
MKSDSSLETNEEDYSDIKDYFNIVLIGDSSVGKTSILEKYINNIFLSEFNNKNLIEIYKKKIFLYTNFYKLKFWDITQFIRKNDVSELDMFYNCDGIIFVSSYDNKPSLDNINTWYQLLIEYIDLSTKEMIWLVNKNDLINDNKILTAEQIEKKSKDLQLDYYEVSAKTGDNIEYSIKNLVKKLIKRCNDNSFDNFDKSTQDSNDVNDNDNPGKKCNIF